VSIQLRGLTEPGLNQASEILSTLRSGEKRAVPEGFLQDPELTFPTRARLKELNGQVVKNRWELALWLSRDLSLDSAGDAALLPPPAWSWLAMQLLDILAPAGDKGRKIREDARYLLQADDYRETYRHLLAGPYFLFRAHADNPSAIRGLLATGPDAPGEVYEQLASRKFLVTSRAVVTVATELYLDSATGRLRRGAGGEGAGSARRLSEVLQQFDKTYDMQNMTPEVLLDLLPQEFRRFLPK
jgi:hypothetical protein